ncbi:MAG TPA: ShlB/FhaC/HecB family hemolysin secretion/activation protein [Burkholderiales bacterium]|nr:ShlB/FhaC/HecB family hemolysin secretion/activation protein [Burkholderiales bacterium]
MFTLCCIVALDASFAQQPPVAVAAPRFDITRFEVVGNTLLPAREVERILAPYTGSGRDFSDVQRALEVLEQSYRDRGYGIVQVLLPEQDITRGVVQFRVMEARVGRVVIEGNKYFDTANIRGSLPSVKEGVTPNSREIQRNLQILGEHPTKQTSVVLRGTGSEDQIDVNVKVTDEKPWRVFLTLDNTGTSETGYLRSGVGFQHSNLFNRDHVLTAQYVTSPTHVDDVTIVGVGYRVPFYQWNSTLDLIAGYANVDSGTLQGLFNVSGSGTIGAARWNYYLPKLGDFEQKLTAGFDYRDYRNNVTLVGTAGSQVPDITLHPVSLTYSGLRRYSDAELSFYGALSTNIPYGSDGDAEAFHRPFQRADVAPRYTILRYGATFVQAIASDWQARLAFNGQYTDDRLVSGEQFGIGGPDSVRGYLVRELASDRGYQAQLELYTPDVARWVGMRDPFRMRFLAFYDYGQVETVNPQPGEVRRARLESLGLGLRLNYGKQVSLRADLAQILHDSPNRNTDSQRVTAAVAVIF